MHLIFDVETSGFLSPNYPLDHPNQGRILQVACLLLDEDLKEVSTFSSLIDIPETVQIHEKAFEAHGLTVEKCKKYGCPIEAAIIMIDSMCAKSQYQAAHNIGFDLRMIHAEETAIFGRARLELKNRICTMEQTTDICKLSHPSGKAGNKRPSLEEAFNHFFNDVLPTDTYHDALVDARKCAGIYRYLWQQGYLDKFKPVDLKIVEKGGDV